MRTCNEVYIPSACWHNVARNEVDMLSACWYDANVNEKKELSKMCAMLLFFISLAVAIAKAAQAKRLCDRQFAYDYCWHACAHAMRSTFLVHAGIMLHAIRSTCSVHAGMMQM